MISVSKTKLKIKISMKKIKKTKLNLQLKRAKMKMNLLNIIKQILIKIFLMVIKSDKILWVQEALGQYTKLH